MGTTVNESVFYDVELRKQEEIRPKSVTRFQSFKDKFRSKRRHHTVATTNSSDILKAGTSSSVYHENLPADLSQRRSNCESSISCCPFDISGYGQFLMMDEFVVEKSRKGRLMVFLFEKIIIFTTVRTS